MNPTAPDPDDPGLRALLRAAHPAPSLPPRFQENVWRRLERAGCRADAASPAGWLEGLVRRVLRPAYATAALVALMLAGAWFGSRDGDSRVRRSDQARYLASVSPFDRVAP